MTDGDERRAETRKLLLVQAGAILTALVIAFVTAGLNRENDKITKRRELRQRTYAKLSGLLPLFIRQDRHVALVRLDVDAAEVKMKELHLSADAAGYTKHMEKWFELDALVWQTRREALEAVGDAKVAFADVPKLQKLIDKYLAPSEADRKRFPFPSASTEEAILQAHNRLADQVLADIDKNVMLPGDELLAEMFAVLATD